MRVHPKKGVREESNRHFTYSVFRVDGTGTPRNLFDGGFYIINHHRVQWGPKGAISSETLPLFFKLQNPTPSTPHGPSTRSGRGRSLVYTDRYSFGRASVRWEASFGYLTEEGSSVKMRKMKHLLQAKFGRERMLEPVPFFF